MSEVIEGWHWIRDDRKLNYPPHDVVVTGAWLHDPRDDDGEAGPIALCKRGYHASDRALDALNYAPGATICRVELRGEILRGDDKMCASRRRVLWMADATATLHTFACDCAEAALAVIRDAGHEVDPGSLEAIAVKRRWIEGEASDEELAAARDAAWAAARDAARAAARDAAWAAARDAAWAAAWAAARAAAWAAARAAARAAAWDAAWAAAWAAQNANLERLLWKLEPVAATQGA